MLYFVFIVTNYYNSTFYVGVTDSLDRKDIQDVLENDNRLIKISSHKLVYFEEHRDVVHAIIRENQIKNYNRSRKLQLIRAMNKDWIDLLEPHSQVASSSLLPLLLQTQVSI